MVWKNTAIPLSPLKKKKAILTTKCTRTDIRVPKQRRSGTDIKRTYARNFRSEEEKEDDETDGMSFVPEGKKIVQGSCVWQQRNQFSDT